jgi:hypothetical protein
MMPQPDDDADAALSLLCDAWDKVTQYWRDDVTENFGTRHWAPLLRESRAYADALRDLTDLLDAATRDTDY